MKEMNTKLTQKRSWFPTVAALAIVAVGIVAATAIIPRMQSAQGIVAAIAISPQAPTTQAGTVNCPADWYLSKDPVLRDTCSRLKETTSQQQRAQELATAAAQPRVQTIPGFQPVTLLPVPDYAKVVTELKFDPYNGAWPPIWDTTTSVWKDGAVPTSDYTMWDEVFVVSRPGSATQSTPPPAGSSATTNTNPTLETEVFGSMGDGTDREYQKRWTCPQAAGAIYITSIINPALNITDAKTPYPGLRSVVYFKTEAGQTGNFDMATETWTFDPPVKAP